MASSYEIMRKGIAPLADFQRMQEEFQLKKQQALATASGQDPASVKLANEIQKARAAGDVQRLNDLQMSAKLLDRGVLMTPEGQAAAMAGYSDVMTEMNYGKQRGSEIAKTQYEPERAGMVEGAKLEQQLGYEPEIKRAVKSAEGSAERQSELNERVSTMPQLEETVRRLTDLGRKATYTKTGQLVDIVRRETGMEPRESAIARKEYISLVDNQILPLLRQTFGAQFTQKEGESLKATLGDPNATPEEKEAVLRSFIQQKQATIETMQRQIGQAPAQRQTTNPAINTPYDQIQPDILAPQEYKEGMEAVNPDTGERLIYTKGKWRKP